MPTEESKRVDAHRRKNFDRLSVLIEKGGRELYRVLALREDCSTTEMIRRAVLARAGLRVLPYPDQLEELKTVETYRDAHTAIRRLQHREEANEIIDHLLQELGGEAATADYDITLDHSDVCEIREAMRKISAAIGEDLPPDDFAPPVTVRLKGRDIGVIRRMLANIEPATPQDHDEPKDADHNIL